MAVDGFVANFLWINQGDGTFVDMGAAAGVDNPKTDMGIALGDYDNDGDIDVFVTVIARNQDHNVFYRNDSVGPNLSFTEIAQTLGVENGDWGWGAIFLDFDNDTLLDLAMTNGKDFEPWITDESKFWLNQGGNPITYLDLSDQVQFNDTYIASALIAFDIDRDGDLDMMQSTSGGPLRLLDNQPDQRAQANHYLVVRPRMTGPNHYAIGSVVSVTVGSTTMMRPIVAGISTLGQEPAEAFFGLGDASVVDQVTIEWPDGRETTLTNVAVDQVLTPTDGPPPVPAVSNLGLVAAALLLAIAAAIELRRAARTR